MDQNTSTGTNLVVEEYIESWREHEISRDENPRT